MVQYRILTPEEAAARRLLPSYDPIHDYNARAQYNCKALQCWKKSVDQNCKTPICDKGLVLHKGYFTKKQKQLVCPTCGVPPLPKQKKGTKRRGILADLGMTEKQESNVTHAMDRLVPRKKRVKKSQKNI